MRLREVLGIVVLMGLPAGAAYYSVAPVQDRLAGRVSVYHFACREWSTEGAPCKSGWKQGAITTYTVDVSRQVVVERTDGSRMDPERHDPCVVADRENWVCTLPGDPGPPLMLKMQEGTIEYDARLKSVNANLQQVPRWKWLIGET